MLLVTWFLIQLKRILKSPVFLCLIAMLPLVTYMLTNIFTGDNMKVSIGITSDSDNQSTKELIANITKGNKVIDFVEYDSVELMKGHIETGKLSCGYIIPEGYMHISSEGDKHQIELLVTKDNVIHSITDEIMFSYLMIGFTKESLNNTVASNDYFSDMDKAFIKDKLYEYYNSYANGDETFKLQYTTTADDIPRTFNIFNYIKTPIKSFAAIVIFITALCSGILVHKDFASGIYKLLSRRCHILLLYLTVFVPTAICGLGGFGTLVFNKIILWSVEEILRLLCYILICSGFALALKLLLKNITLYISTIPFFLLGSLIFCPLFVNLANIAPAFRIMSYLFIPNIYI